MKAIESGVKTLAQAICKSPEYLEYKRRERALDLCPELREKVDQIRDRNFHLQNGEWQDGMIDELEENSRCLEEIRSNPVADAFLAAELDLCKLVQNVTWDLFEEIDFRTPDV